MSPDPETERIVAAHPRVVGIASGTALVLHGLGHVVLPMRGADVTASGVLAPAYAAQSKNQDAILEAADAVVTACANCHGVYRDKGVPGGQVAARCVK